MTTSLGCGCFYNKGMPKQDDLVTYLFEGQPHLLAGELYHWMDASSRFTAFVETYRDKVRKKIRMAGEPESALDVRSELEVAFCLLSDRRLDVAYEPYANLQRRGPDFAVTHRTNLLFNIEVARMRTEESDLQRKTEERILRILLSKLGQMQPGKANLLVIHTRNEIARSVDLNKLMQEIKTRAEGKERSFYEISRYASPAAFYKDFLHLSGIVLWTAEAQPWVNKQARPGLDEKVLRLVSSLSSCAS